MINDFDKIERSTLDEQQDEFKLFMDEQVRIVKLRHKEFMRTMYLRMAVIGFLLVGLFSLNTCTEQFIDSQIETNGNQ